MLILPTKIVVSKGGRIISTDFTYGCHTYIQLHEALMSITFNFNHAELGKPNNKIELTQIFKVSQGDHYPGEYDWRTQYAVSNLVYAIYGEDGFDHEEHWLTQRPDRAWIDCLMPDRHSPRYGNEKVFSEYSRKHGISHVVRVMSNNSYDDWPWIWGYYKDRKKAEAVVKSLKEKFHTVFIDDNKYFWFDKHEQAKGE